MQNLRLGLKLLNVIAPGIDTGAIADEIRERIREELDYELEAATTARWRGRTAGIRSSSCRTSSRGCAASG